MTTPNQNPQKEGTAMALPDKPNVLLLIKHPSGIGVHGWFTAEKANAIAKYMLDDLVTGVSPSHK